MIACASPDAAPSAPVAAFVRIGHGRYEVVPPETTRISVARGGYVAIPLYDGNLESLAASETALRYLGVASVPRLECVRTAAGRAASHRVALFRAIGRPGDRATVLVRLTLPGLREACASCRTVHFFVRMR
jgi:hypothetical protein